MPSELATTLAASEEDRLLQAEALVRAYCGWHIAPVKTHMWSLGTADTTIVLPTLRLFSVLTVTDGTTVLDPSAYTWTDTGILTFTPDSIVCSWVGDFVRELRDSAKLTVQAMHGFDDVPPEVTAVVQAIATRAVNNPRGLVRETVGPFTDAYATGLGGYAPGVALLEDEKRVLAPYKLPARL